MRITPRFCFLTSLFILVTTFTSSACYAVLDGAGSHMTLPSWGEASSAMESRYQPVVSTRGMVSADDRIAAEWGAEILRRGGNAMDAAVATAFAMAVTRPHYASLGGGGFLLFCPKKKPANSVPPPCTSLDFRERAPSAAHRDMYMVDGVAHPERSQTGALAIGVPGIPAGLLKALEKFGTLPRKKLLTRPIQLAKQGYPFSANTESAAIERWTEMNPSAQKIFGCRTTKISPLAPCPAGTWMKQTDLGKVLEEISEKGTSAFYQGWIARKLVEGIRQSGGVITLKDLKFYQPIVRLPLKTTLSPEFAQPHFQNTPLEVISMPPPSSGGIVLMQLLAYAQMAAQSGNLNQGFGSSETVHTLAHAMALAFSDRAEFLGDPGFVQIPISRLLAPSYLQEKWKPFDPEKANLKDIHPSKPLQQELSEPKHTTHFSVIDREGNAVAMTLTVNANFGSGFVPRGTGIVMNNQMDDFSIHLGTPNFFGLVGSEANAVAPGKTPLSSMTPTIVRDADGQVRLVLGAAGGPKIVTAVFQSLVNRIRFGMSLPDSVSAPRFHHQWKPETLELEADGFSVQVRTALEKKGYQLNLISKAAKVHALERFSNQRIWGIADPRGEGAAVPE